MLDQYRSNLAHFQESLGRESFLYYSGQKRSLALYPIYDRFADLFTFEAVQDLKRLYETTSEHFSRQRRGLKRLIAFAESHFVEKRVHELTEQLAAEEKQEMLRLGSQEIPFFRAPDTLATEAAFSARREVHKQMLQTMSRSHQLREERLKQLHDNSQTLGYENYWTLVAAQQECDLQKYEDQFARFLDHTEDLYLRLLDDVLPSTVGLTRTQADQADIEYFLQLHRYAERFPEDGVIVAYDETLRASGIAEKRRNIAIDHARRPERLSLSRCIPIRVPEEIKISLDLRRSPRDYQTMMREGGHAQHYAWTSPTLPIEFAIAGDPAVGEGYAFLFQYLLLDPSWLNETLNFVTSQEFIKLGWLQKLFCLRRYAARFICECRLRDSGDLTEAGQQYARRMTEATGFQHQAEVFLYDLNHYGQAVHHLRGALFEVQLRDYLKTRFGKNWWKSAKAADTLIDLWNTGSEYPAEELASLADLGALSLDHLMNEFTAALGVK